MFTRKLLIIPGTLFLLGFMPYSGSVEDNAEIPFSEPILELQNVEKMMDEEFYRENYMTELPESNPRSEVPPSLLEELNEPTNTESKEI
tara:strand:+ start:315 stop:581 length:267 start_codon:yes stop_codon:yes gene_type:complete